MVSKPMRKIGRGTTQDFRLSYTSVIRYGLVDRRQAGGQ